MPKLKKLPKFKTIQQERVFWEKHDSTHYIDWKQAKNATFPKLLARGVHVIRKEI